MTGDYTRFTHRPRERYSGVLMQQGRVQLDADANEQVEIVKDRFRSQARDTFGDTAISRFSTPDAFKIDLLPGDPLDFSIGPGRIYVDGVMAEAFAEEDLRYWSQPFLPEPLPLPESGRVIVYVDVWEREVTYIEDPDLLEAALGGPDTTTRTQTVWQVKWEIPEVGNVECGLDLDSLFPPSAGRLTTSAFAVPPSDEPCVVSSEGGYHGLENRLYRVEVHTPGLMGTTGTARFKWSRDNASIVSAVEKVEVHEDETELTVSRIGRDKFLRFRKGDWVTVTNDHRELMGLSGEMAKIKEEPDETTRLIVLDRALPIDLATDGSSDPENSNGPHTRVQRWDQNETNSTVNGVSRVDPNDGLIPITNEPVHLEDGVQVTFSVAQVEGEFKVADYWVFATRTVAGSIELLQHAPPRGIVHRYAQLADVTGLGDVVHVTDCREPYKWPPLPKLEGMGCCTVAVRPGEDIQAAIDSLPADEGGCVCLLAGTHTIDAPLRIQRSNVVLRGEGPGTKVECNNHCQVLWIGPENGRQTRLNIVVEGIWLQLCGAPDPHTCMEGQDPSVVLVTYSAGVTLRNCQLSTDGVATGSTGVYLIDGEDIGVENNWISEIWTGIFALRGANYRASRNTIFAFREQGEDFSCGVWLSGTRNVRACRASFIEHNCIDGFSQGVLVWGVEPGIQISGNYILPAFGIAATGIRVYTPKSTVNRNVVFLTPSTYGIIGGDSAIIEHNRLEEIGAVEDNIARAVGIHAIGPRSIVRANEMTARSPLRIGVSISAHADGTSVEKNRLEWASQLNSSANPTGIEVFGVFNKNAENITIIGNEIWAFCCGISAKFTLGIRVLDNKIIGPGPSGLQSDGISTSKSRNALVARNHVERCATGIGAGTEGSSNEGNHRVLENSILSCENGIVYHGHAGPEETPGFVEISGNEISGMNEAGIRVFDSGSGNVVIASNHLRHCAQRVIDFPGLLIAAPRANVNVTSCEVIDTGGESDGSALGIIIVANTCSLSQCHVSFSLHYDPNKQRTALLAVVSQSVSVLDNRFIGKENVLAFVWTGHLWPRQTAFMHNYCEQENYSDRSTVHLAGDYITVIGNVIESTAGFLAGPSFELVQASDDPNYRGVLYVGNTTTTDHSNVDNIPMKPSDVYTLNNVKFPK